MPGKSADHGRLFGKRWVHVFEEDSAQGAVYRPEDDSIPLSRRPRERLELDQDGSATLFAPGADDRFVEQPATWRDEGGALVIRSAETGDVELRIVDRSPERLIVQILHAPPPG